MRNLFSIDSKFFTFMEKIADLMILNFLFLVTSLPLVTIGASLTALYAVSLKQCNQTSSYIVKEYFQAWKSSFRQSTILWCCSLLVFLLLTLNLQFSRSHPVMHALITVILLLSGMSFLYFFPLLAKFQNTLKHTVVNAFLLSVRHFFTTTVLAGTCFSFIYFTVYTSGLFSFFLVSWMLFLFALLIRIQSVFLHRMFVKYTPEHDV